MGLAVASTVVKLHSSAWPKRVVGEITIIAPRPETLFEVPEAEAADHLEEPIQLVEGQRYEFRLGSLLEGHSLQKSEVVTSLSDSPEVGIIEPGLETGLLSFVLEDPFGQEVGRASVEVRSSKVGYRADYRQMLDFVAEQAVGLLLEWTAPGSARLKTVKRAASVTRHQQLALLLALLNSDEVKAAMGQILAVPHHRLAPDRYEQDIRKGFKPNPTALRQLASSARRTAVPPSHPLHAVISSLPERTTQYRATSSVDTPENRFVKHALTEFEAFLATVEGRLATDSGTGTQRLRARVSVVRRQIAEWLSRDLFVAVGEAQSLPLSSPVLQRRAGYRELLQAWFKFHLATHLTWQAADDMHAAGKKDVALLYEYWTFFQMLELMSRRFRIPRTSWQNVIEPTADGFDLKVQAGRALLLDGKLECGGRDFNVQFGFNQTFSSTPYPCQGSWTMAMRPDMTLVLWPAAFERAQAERQELVSYLHFDAKYRVEKLVDLFGTGSAEDLSDEKEALRSNRYAKRSDLLKMHAYRDAIRRSRGAYVLYPGTPDGTKYWRQYHEILPGLGAFPLSPAWPSGIDAIEDFVRDAARDLCDRAGRLEQETYHQFRIQESTGRFRERTRLPRYGSDGSPLRPVPALEALGDVPRRPSRGQRSAIRQRRFQHLPVTDPH